MSEPVSFTGQRGAGVYGRDPVPVGHRCGRCANPFTGGREDCPRVWDSLPTVPYEEPESAYEYDEVQP